MTKPRRRRCKYCGELHHANMMAAYDCCETCLRVYSDVSRYLPKADKDSTVREIVRNPKGELAHDLEQKKYIMEWLYAATPYQRTLFEQQLERIVASNKRAALTVIK